MPIDTKSTIDSGSPPPARRQTLAGLALLGVLVAAVVCTFAYVGGWFTPGKLTPKKFVDVFQAVDGEHAGFRRNHAKGLCVSGHFDSSGNGAAISKAAVFQPGRSEVVGRFSLGGGLPFQADTPTQVRGLGLQLTSTSGQVWRTAMINLPVFPVSTPQAFYERLQAGIPDAKTGKPDPAKMTAFNASHPESVAAVKIIKMNPPSAGFGDSTFHGLNAFVFCDSQGKSTPVRWVLEPVRSASTTAPAIAPATRPDDPNYLFDALIDAIHTHPLQWHLMLIVGQEGDPTNDASKPWPPSRQRIDAGMLTLDAAQSEDTSPTYQLNFDPLVLPDGIAPSDDPILSARSAVYSNSFTRRSGEHKPPSALTPASVNPK